MIDIIDKDKCCGCSACYNICPKDAIEMKKDDLGFLYPVIDKEKCIKCGLCKKVCPVLCNNYQTNPKAYACINKDEKVRLKSSSGGIFSLLAEQILNQDGVVFGAGFDENFKVKHISIENKEDLQKLRMSKYVQSDIGRAYREAEKLLKEKRKVLFTGTTCQIQGLVNYLEKDYENLYLQDIICHGVPSPVLWDKYIKYREEKDKNKTKNIEFRNKDNGWKDFNLKFKYENSEYKGNQVTDEYLKMFLRDFILREACYECEYRGKKRASDITLADFWGIQKILPEMDDDKGTSLVIVNTEKGARILDSIKESMIYKEVELEEAVKDNKNYYMSAQKPKNREKFIKDIEKLSLNKLAKKYISTKRDSLYWLKKIKKVIVKDNTEL